MIPLFRQKALRDLLNIRPSRWCHFPKKWCFSILEEELWWRSNSDSKRHESKHHSTAPPMHSIDQLIDWISHLSRQISFLKILNGHFVTHLIDWLIDWTLHLSRQILLLRILNGHFVTHLIDWLIDWISYLSSKFRFPSILNGHFVIGWSTLRQLCCYIRKKVFSWPFASFKNE